MSSAPFLKWTAPEGFTALTEDELPYTVAPGDVALSATQFEATKLSDECSYPATRAYWGFQIPEDFTIHELSDTGVYIGALPTSAAHADVSRLPQAQKIAAVPFKLPERGVVFSENGESWYTGHIMTDSYTEAPVLSGDDRSFAEIEAGATICSPTGRRRGDPAPSLWFLPAPLNCTHIAVLEVGEWAEFCCASAFSYSIDGETSALAPWDPKLGKFRIRVEAKSRSVKCTQHHPRVDSMCQYGTIDDDSKVEDEDTKTAEDAAYVAVVADDAEVTDVAKDTTDGATEDTNGATEDTDGAKGDTEDTEGAKGDTEDTDGAKGDTEDTDGAKGDTTKVAEKNAGADLMGQIAKLKTLIQQLSQSGI